MSYEFYGRVKRLVFDGKNKIGEFRAESSVKFNDKTYDIAFNANPNNVNQCVAESQVKETQVKETQIKEIQIKETRVKETQVEESKKSKGTSSNSMNTPDVIIIPQQLILNKFFVFISSHSNSRFLIEFDETNNAVTKVVLCNE